MRKNLIFDVGDVLLEYRWRDMLMDYGLSKEEAEKVGGVVFGNKSWNMLDLGTMTKEEVIEEYKRIAPEQAEHIEWFVNHGELMHVRRPDIWERVHDLKQAGYSIYILSNYSEDLFQKHTKDASFLADLDGGVISYEIHSVKPEPAIYQCLLEKYHLNPEECVFFDDRRENTEAAEKFGIKTYTITSREYLRGVLDAYLGMEEKS